MSFRLAGTWLALAFIGLPAIASAGQPKDLAVRYLPPQSFTAETRDASAPIRARAARTSVRYFTVGADFALAPETPSVDFGPGIGVALADRTFRRAPGDFTWIGRLPGGDGRVHLVSRGGRITGALATRQGTAEILPLSGTVHGLIGYDARVFSTANPPGPPPRGPVRPKPAKTAKVTLRAGEAPVVDLFVGYTSAAKTAYGGDMHALAQLAVDTTNTAFLDSGANLQLNLTGSREVPYAGDFPAALGDLAAGANGLDVLKAAADAAGADLVNLLIASATTACGQSYLNSTAENALSVVTWTCALPSYAFAKEIARNIGAAHDPYAMTSTAPYSYGYAYVYKPGLWRTIVATGKECADAGLTCPPIPRFSTPNRTFDGVPTGTAEQNDNARVLTERGPAVAAFKAGSTFTLTLVRVEPGLVTSDPAGIDCGGTCTASFAPDTSVTLTAVPAENTTFSGWAGACSGTSATCTVAMTTSRAVTATFARVPRTLAVTLEGDGTGKVTSSPAGIDCGTACSADFPDGTGVTLTAVPDPGFVLAAWRGACTGTTTTCTVAMTAALSVTAVFTRADRQLTVVKEGVGGGVVRSAPAGIDCGTTCSATFSLNTLVTLTAVPALDSSFAGWSGACLGTAPTCQVPMSAARTVRAGFRKMPLLIVAKRGRGIGMVVSKPLGIRCGTSCSKAFLLNRSVTLTARPSTTATFGGWSGACKGKQATCTVKMTTRRNVQALFYRKCTGPLCPPPAAVDGDIAAESELSPEQP